MIGAIKRIETTLITEGQPVTAGKVLNVYLNKSDDDLPSLVETFQDTLAQRAKTVGLPDGITNRTLTR